MTNTTANTTTTATNTTATATATRSADLQRRVNEAAVTGAKSILGFAGDLAANGQLKMSIDIQLTINASEENTRDKGDSASLTNAEVTLNVHADIDGSIAITGDGECHGERR